MEWATTPSGSGVAHAQMRARNMGLVLRQLYTVGDRSRAELAEATGLSKATLTSVIAELVDRRLVSEGKPHRSGGVGRPGIHVSCAGSWVCGVGVEFNLDYVTIAVADLSGAVENAVIAVPDDAADPHATVRQVAELLNGVLADLRAEGRWVAGITVAVPGSVDYETDSVRYIANLRWHDVPLLAELRALLDGEHVPPLGIENDAKLSALAAQRVLGSEIRDLMYLTGGTGVGAGIIMDGRLVRGWQGLSGEVGHLPMDPQGKLCICGRRGCWETLVGFQALVDAVPGGLAQDRRRPILERIQELVRLDQQGDERIRHGIEAVRAHLLDGLAILVEVLSPQLIVMGGYFAFFPDSLVTPLSEELTRGRVTRESEVRVVASSLGLHAAARGGAVAALERVLHDPSSVPAASER